MKPNIVAGFGMWQWLEIVEHELLLFAAVFFLIGALDELIVDLAWLYLKLTGRTRSMPFIAPSDPQLKGIAAVLVPAWREADVIAAMIRHTLTSWSQSDLRLYVGCYPNDPATLAAVKLGVADDLRVKIVLHTVDGPTTKADCLNQLYAALVADECRSDVRARSVILHDAEDMVDPAGLPLIDRMLDEVDFVQLPVIPVPQASSRWISGHYGDEFAEAHGKTMVVRDRLGAGLPAAGVGCGFARDVLDTLVRERGGTGPFAADSLTEDYELGLLIAEAGGRQRFVRARAPNGLLIATRELFPTNLHAAVRQKTRWLHGIAFQGWDRLGWSGSFGERWMRLRDRRGPLTALVLAVGYLVILLWGVLFAVEQAGWHEPAPTPESLTALLWINFAAFFWRASFRFGFTVQAYGWAEGLRAIPRIPVANIIAIMAGRRATAAYLRSLMGGTLVWEKTPHHVHASTLASPQHELKR